MNLHKELIDSSSYDESYFETGVEKGISGYQNYRWMPELTESMCKSIVSFCDISSNDKVLDFGCAKGFIVKAMKIMGYDCVGCDISEYAISAADNEIKPFLHLLLAENCNDWLKSNMFDVILAKDVLEHVPERQLSDLVSSMYSSCNKLFVIVPLAQDDKYVIPDYENDVTHVVRKDEVWWVNLFKSAGFDVEFRHLVKGIKDNWSQYERGNGFFLCTKK